MSFVRLITVLLLLSSPALAKGREWPWVVTKSAMRQLGKTWQLIDRVDPAQGVVVIHYVVDSANENAVSDVSAKRYCGDQLPAELARWQPVVPRFGNWDTGSRCSNGVLPTCRFGEPDEYGVSMSLVFRPSAVGLELDAIILEDDGAQGEAWRAKQRRYVWGQITRLRQTDCAGNPQTPPAAYRNPYKR